MAIKCIQLVQVICDDCGKSIFLEKWRDAAKLGWAAPIDGGMQKCPPCLEKYKDKIFAEAKMIAISKKCPLVNND